MNKIISLFLLVVVIGFSKAQNYISIEGYNYYQYFANNHCQKQPNQLRFAYIIQNEYMVNLNTYLDEDCKKIYNSNTLGTGYQDNGDYISFTNSINLKESGFLYNVFYGNGTGCNGGVSYATAQAMGVCEQQYPDNPKSHSTQITNCKGSTAYTTTIYADIGCKVKEYSNTNDTETVCSTSTPGHYSICIA